MARAIWTGSVSFGLVNVHNTRVAEGSDREVAYDDIVKGYEVSSGTFVMVTGVVALSDLAQSPVGRVPIRPWASRASTSASPRPASSVSTSRLCWPTVGAGQRVQRSTDR